MTIAEIVSAGAKAFLLYTELRKAAEGQGMSPEEFDESAAKECIRIDKWIADSNAAEDSVFSSATTDND